MAVDCRRGHFIYLVLRVTEINLVVVPINDETSGGSLSQMNNCIVMVHNYVLRLLIITVALHSHRLLLMVLLRELALHILEHLLDILILTSHIAHHVRWKTIHVHIVSS